jgi:quinol-cytochrome oxidoreductase complex cytochrome b subunit/coenzyme F420-reducing hydrogenase delta subunit/Pyruvate/2-oxoacid:ferredoxin oxidoreductase delta subunit
MTTVTRFLRSADELATSTFDRAFKAAHNPWRHLGALAFLCLVLVVLSGIIAYALYDTSVSGAYQSGLRLQNDPSGLGRLLRGLHRYGADACMLLTLLHLVREGLRGHFRGVRWFSWLTGIPLLWLLWIAGITGLWLLWDERAIFSVTATAEWLQALPLGADLLARNFLTADTLNDRFFSLIMFVHIGMPLLLLAAMWVHVLRVSRVRIWPPRSLTRASLAMLAVLALLVPVLSLGPADTGHVLQRLSIDWFYQFVHPLVDLLSAHSAWLLVAVLTLALALLPLLPAREERPRVAARVDPANCNGCSRCVADCPFGAVTMVARTDASRHPAQAQVDSALCAACGICVGACPSATPFRRGEAMVSGIEMPQTPVATLRRELQRKIGALSGSNRIVVFGCRQAADFDVLADAATAVLTLECAAMLPPSFLEYAMRMGASGVLIAGCRESDCEFRLGDRWVKERLLGQREPRLRAAAPLDRIEVVWSGRDMLDAGAAVTKLRSRVLDLTDPGAHHPERINTK